MSSAATAAKLVIVSALILVFGFHLNLLVSNGFHSAKESSSSVALPSSNSLRALTTGTITDEELDELGDLYYQNQLGERGCDRPSLMEDLVPRFPCVRGVNERVYF